MTYRNLEIIKYKFKDEFIKNKIYLSSMDLIIKDMSNDDKEWNYLVDEMFSFLYYNVKQIYYFKKEVYIQYKDIYISLLEDKKSNKRYINVVKEEPKNYISYKYLIKYYLMRNS